MSLFRKRLGQFKDYMELKKDESALSGKLITKYQIRSRKETEYDEFKRSIIHNIDSLFNRGKTKVVIQPKPDKINLYEILVKDEDFKRYYNFEIKEGNNLEITMKVI